MAFAPRTERLNLLPCFWFRELRIRGGLTVVGSLWRYGVDDVVRSLHVALNMSLHSSCSLDTEVRLVPPAVFSLGAPRSVLSSSKPNIGSALRSFRPPIKFTLGFRCRQSLGIVCSIISRLKQIC